MAHPLIRHMHAGVWYLHILINPLAIHPYQCGCTIKDSIRGWPLLGSLTLHTTEQREQMRRENETQAKRSEYAIAIAIPPPLILRSPIHFFFLLWCQPTRICAPGFCFLVICLLISELCQPGMIHLLQSQGSFPGLQTTETFWTIQTDRHTQISQEPANTGPYLCLILCYRPDGQCSPH